VSQYKISAEEIASFARRIYEEACYGYLDLKDSVCDRLVREFLCDRQVMSIDPAAANVAAGVWTGGPWVGGSTTVSGTSLGVGDSTFSIQPGSVQRAQGGIQITASSGHRIEMVDSLEPGDVAPSFAEQPTLFATEDGIEIRNADGVRIGEFVPDQNYEGNSSERL
jgi:hypothetical protein